MVKIDFSDQGTKQDGDRNEPRLPVSRSSSVRETSLTRNESFRAEVLGGSSTASSTPLSSRQSSISGHNNLSDGAKNMRLTLSSMFTSGKFSMETSRKEAVIAPSKDEEEMLTSLIDKSSTISRTSVNGEGGMSVIGHSNGESTTESESEPDTPSLFNKLKFVLTGTGSHRSTSSSASGRAPIEMVTDNDVASADSCENLSANVDYSNHLTVAKNKGNSFDKSLHILNGHSESVTINGHLSSIASNSSTSPEPHSLSISMTSNQSQTKG